MKRAISLLLAISMVFVLCACGNKLTGIFLNQNSMELEIDETAALTYSLVPENASSKKITWQSVNTDIVTVDNDGNLHAIAPGTTTIICSSPQGIMDTCEVVVKEPSAIDQLNEYEKWFFDVLVEKFLPSFYNPSAARVKLLGPTLTEDYEKNMLLDVRIQGENRMGGTLYKDYMICCERNIEESIYMPCFTDNGLFASPHEWNDNTKIDISKVNFALEEYWNNKGM